MKWRSPQDVKESTWQSEPFKRFGLTVIDLKDANGFMWPYGNTDKCGRKNVVG